MANKFFSLHKLSGQITDFFLLPSNIKLLVHAHAKIYEKSKEKQ